MSSFLSDEAATRNTRLANFLDAAAELFAEIGYEADTMTAIAEPRRFPPLNCWSALDVRTRRAPHICNGKCNAELGSIVWIVLSP